MSTTYYLPESPITSLRLTEGDGVGHDTLTLWENGANAGTLTLSAGAGREVASIFRGEPVARSSWAGPDGMRLTLWQDIDDGQCVICENGTVTTIGALAKTASKIILEEKSIGFADPSRQE